MSTLFSYKSAALLVGFSAALHLVAIPFAGGSAMLSLLITAVIMGVLAFGLYRSVRWLAYFAFVGLIIGMIVSFALSYGGDSIPSWLHAINAIANLAAVIILFVLLWRPKSAAV